MRLYNSLCLSVGRLVGWSVTLNFFYDFISLTSLLLPKWSDNLKYGPCPPARDFGSRVSGLVFVCFRFLFAFLLLCVLRAFTLESHLNCRYHIGTLAFGSLVIAVVQFIRAILEYVDQKLKKHHENEVQLSITKKNLKGLSKITLYSEAVLLAMTMKK